MDVGGDPAGPLQAFGQVHRALRENEKRLSSFAGESREQQQRMHEATRRLQQDGSKLRAEMSDMIADVEELVLQSYQELEGKFEAEKAENAKLREEQAAHRAALVAQQGQIDALATALRRQQEVIDEHMGGSAVQISAMQAESAELHRAFKAQGAAVQATKAFISSVDEKLSAMIEERAQASDNQLAAAAGSLQQVAGENRRLIERVLAWEPQLKANDENLSEPKYSALECCFRMLHRRPFQPAAYSACT